MPHVVASQLSTQRIDPLALNESAAHTPAAIRQAIAHWVGQDRMDMADALVAAGLAMHPDSQDILAIAALVAEMNQDWAQAQECLEHLMRLQGEGAGADLCHHLVRVMRCRAAYHQAWLLARRSRLQHPEHAGLGQECAELAALFETVPVQVRTQVSVG